MTGHLNKDFELSIWL